MKGVIWFLLVTSSIGNSEVIIHVHVAYARLFSYCYNKQGIQSNLPSHSPMNKGTIYVKVYSEGVQQIKGKLWTDSCTLRAKDFSSFSICRF